MDRIRSRTALRAGAWVASGVLAGGLLVGVGLAHGSASGDSGTTTQAAGADDLAQLAGLGLADPTTPAPGQGDAKRLRKLPGRGGVGAGRLAQLGRGVLHGELVLQTKDGVKTFLVQRGTISALGSSTVTVKSTDGFTTTWKVASTTRFGRDQAKDSLRELKVGDQVGVVGQKADTPTALVLRARTPRADGEKGRDRAGTPSAPSTSKGTSST